MPRGRRRLRRRHGRRRHLQGRRPRPPLQACRGGRSASRVARAARSASPCANEVDFLWQEVVRSAGVVVVWGLLILGVLRLRSEIDRAWAWAAMVQLFYFLMTMSRFAAIHHVSFPLPLQQLSSGFST